MTAKDATIAARDDDQIPHGKPSTYTNWFCRCFDCTKAVRDFRRERRAVRNG